MRTFSLSCLLVGALALIAHSALANSNNSWLTDNEKDKVKKTDNTFFVLNTAIPKTNLRLDASYRYGGSYTSDFKFTNTNTINVKSVMTYTKGNITYVVPYSVSVPQQMPGNMNFQKLQIILPLKKG